MSEKREEFLKRINVGNEDNFTAARVESERIRTNLRKLEEINEQIKEAKDYLWSGKDLSSENAVHAAMFASATLRREQEKTQNEIKESEKFINGER